MQIRIHIAKKSLIWLRTDPKHQLYRLWLIDILVRKTWTLLKFFFVLVPTSFLFLFSNRCPPSLHFFLLIACRFWSEENALKIFLMKLWWCCWKDNLITAIAGKREAGRRAGCGLGPADGWGGGGGGRAARGPTWLERSRDHPPDRHLQAGGLVRLTPWFQ